MLNAAVFDDFKGATTLLVWGDGEGMETLLAGLSAVRDGKNTELVIDGPNGGLVVSSVAERGEVSTLDAEGKRLRWVCSPDAIELAADLVEPLLDGAGHQFLDVSGLAEQVVIARDEYPADLR